MGAKPMLLYRGRTTTKIHNPYNLSIELYPGGRGPDVRGQVALLGGHPGAPAGRYTYPREPVLAVPLGELPELTDSARAEIVTALQADPLVGEHGQVAERAPGEDWTGEGQSWLAQARERWPDLASWLVDIGPGGRHYCCTACVMLVLGMRLPVDEEAAHLEALEVAFLEAKPGARREWDGILRWARTQQQRRRTRGAEARRRLGLKEVCHA
jgi:hypothetical protein